jgi:acyl dehydratase
MSTGVRFEDVAVGDSIPSFVRTTHFPEWNRYAAVNDEFIPMHMDDEAGRAAGNEHGAFGMGNLRLSYLVNMLRAWCGEDCEIRQLSLRYSQLNQKHDHLRCVGDVIAKQIVNGERRIRLRIDVLNQDGDSTTPGEAEVVFPAPEGDGAGSAL